MSDLTESLTAYLLGLLSRAERAAVEAELRSSPVAVAELAALSEVLGDLSLAESSVEPAFDLDAGRARLLSALDVPIDDAHAPWSAEVLQTFFDVSRSAAEAILARAASKASWEPGLIPGMSLLHLQPGPSWATADAGLVKLAEGLVFPPHAHIGVEISLVLHGELEVDDGRVYGPGQELRMEAGSSHSYRVRGSECVFALLLHEGIRFGPRPEDEVRKQR